MKYCRFALFVLIMSGTDAIAQGSNSYDGKWLADVKWPDGQVVQATMIVKGNGGTFSYNYRATHRRGDPCFAMEAPITVSRATAEEFEFVINRSSVGVGCVDTKTMTLRRVDDKTLVAKGVTYVRQ